MLTDGPSSTIGSCIMSALSIPPSHKTSISVRLESVHNYANILNPIAVVGAEQFSVVAVYTETEESRLDSDMMETAEVQLQTDCYEEEIVVAGEDGRVDVAGFRSEEAGEAVGVAKALETLTKAFALRKESIGQEAQTGPDLEHEAGHQTDKERENIVEEEMEDSQDGDAERIMDSSAALEDNHISFPVCEETVPEQSCSVKVRRSTRLQRKTSPNWQELSTKKSSTADPEMYKPLLL